MIALRKHKILFHKQQMKETDTERERGRQRDKLKVCIEVLVCRVRVTLQCMQNENKYDIYITLRYVTLYVCCLLQFLLMLLLSKMLKNAKKYCVILMSYLYTRAYHFISLLFTLISIAYVVWVGEWVSDSFPVTLL